MTWRLMWHPRPVEGQASNRSPLSLLSEEVETDAEARARVRELRMEGFRGISVTAAGLIKIMTGSELQRWLDRT